MKETEEKKDGDKYRRGLEKGEKYEKSREWGENRKRKREWDWKREEGRSGKTREEVEEREWMKYREDGKESVGKRGEKRDRNGNFVRCKHKD